VFFRFVHRTSRVPFADTAGIGGVSPNENTLLIRALVIASRRALTPRNSRIHWLPVAQSRHIWHIASRSSWAWHQPSSVAAPDSRPPQTDFGRNSKYPARTCRQDLRARNRGKPVEVQNSHERVTTFSSANPYGLSANCIFFGEAFFLPRPRSGVFFGFEGPVGENNRSGAYRVNRCAMIQKPSRRCGYNKCMRGTDGHSPLCRHAAAISWRRSFAPKFIIARRFVFLVSFFPSGHFLIRPRASGNRPST